jgi:hypothetical protein
VSRVGRFGAFGAVCRDQSGTFLAASVVVFSSIEDPTTLETLVVREALALADDLYIQRIFVASDGKVVVEAIKEGIYEHFGACA